MKRTDWINLNGLWDFAILPLDSTALQSTDGTILVPYALESYLSGVQKSLMPNQKLWYRRTFQDPRPYLCRDGSAEGGWRILLHFGAVDEECKVWVNDNLVGEHRGGYLPFTLDITDSLQLDENELIVSVCDPTDTGMQQRGKQTLHPKGIWYTSVSGIWQTVWLEGVPGISIKSLKLTPHLDLQELTVEVVIRGAMQAKSVRLEAEASLNGDFITSVTGDVNAALKLSIRDPKPWSPTNPTLYDLRVRLTQEGQVLDEVGSYFAMRQFGLVRGSDGYLRFALNGKPLFLYGTLDQGYFPDGLYTPPTEEAMLFDIEYTRQIGCNMIRKHVKIEPLRWYYHCDRLGMIVWQDMPNGGLIDGETVSIITQIFGFHRNDTRGLSRFGRTNEGNRANFRSELQGMVDHLYNSPCIAVWVPFNESWGQFQANKISKWLKAYDPTRLVDHASGWFDQGGGDFKSKHIYIKKLKRYRDNKRAFAITEFGGYSLKIPSHVWDERIKFGYRFFDTPQALTDAYLALLENELKPLIPQGLAVAIYTQTTDVETEINGFLTYDRKVEKMDPKALRDAHQELTGTSLSQLDGGSPAK